MSNPHLDDLKRENSIDAFIAEGEDSRKSYERMMQSSAHILHIVFVQNEKGAELLETWKSDLMMMDSFGPQSTPFEAGLNEGKKMFVRDILRQIAIVEHENE